MAEHVFETTLNLRDRDGHLVVPDIEVEAAVRVDPQGHGYHDLMMITIVAQCLDITFLSAKDDPIHAALWKAAEKDLQSTSGTLYSRVEDQMPIGDPYAEHRTIGIGEQFGYPA